FSNFMTRPRSTVKATTLARNIDRRFFPKRQNRSLPLRELGREWTHLVSGSDRSQRVLSQLRPGTAPKSITRITYANTREATAATSSVSRASVSRFGTVGWWCESARRHDRTFGKSVIAASESFDLRLHADHQLTHRPPFVPSDTQIRQCIHGM